MDTERFFKYVNRTHIQFKKIPDYQSIRGADFLDPDPQLLGTVQVTWIQLSDGLVFQAVGRALEMLPHCQDVFYNPPLPEFTNINGHRCPIF